MTLNVVGHDPETDVMTYGGWRSFTQLDGSEPLLMMNHFTHEAAYRVPSRILAVRYKGPMYLYEAKGANFCVTPDHMMYFHGRNGRSQDTAWRKAPMKFLADKTNKYMKKSITWARPDAETFTIPAIRGLRKNWLHTVPMDNWLEFLGWYLSEGHLIHSGRRRYLSGVGISQKNLEVLREIHELA